MLEGLQLMLAKLRENEEAANHQSAKHGVLAAALYERRGEGVDVPPAGVEGLEVLPNQCHQNVTDWCEANPGDEPVRGWLFFDFPVGPVMFMAHSVVRHDGHLADITPQDRRHAHYLFIPHQGDQAEFQALVESGVTQLWHRR